MIKVRYYGKIKLYKTKLYNESQIVTFHKIYYPKLNINTFS